MGADAVFISYSHDSPEHSDRVLALANTLIALDLDVELDQFVDSPEHGWPHWCEERLRGITVTLTIDRKSRSLVGSVNCHRYLQ